MPIVHHVCGGDATAGGEDPCSPAYAIRVIRCAGPLRRRESAVTGAPDVAARSGLISPAKPRMLVGFPLAAGGDESSSDLWSSPCQSGRTMKRSDSLLGGIMANT